MSRLARARDRLKDALPRLIRKGVRCQETQDLIHGYVDGELDLVRSIEIDRHIEGCELCSRAYGDLTGVFCTS